MYCYIRKKHYLCISLIKVQPTKKQTTMKTEKEIKEYIYAYNCHKTFDHVEVAKLIKTTHHDDNEVEIEYDVPYVDEFQEEYILNDTPYFTHPSELWVRVHVFAQASPECRFPF